MQHQHCLPASLHLFASPSRLVSTSPACTPGKPLCMHAAHSEREGGGAVGEMSTDTNRDTNTPPPPAPPSVTQAVTTEMWFQMLFSMFVQFSGCRPPILRPPYHPLFDIAHRSVGLPERQGHARQILGNGFAYTLPPAFYTPDHHQRLHVAYIRYKNLSYKTVNKWQTSLWFTWEDLGCYLMSMAGDAVRRTGRKICHSLFDISPR